MDVNTPPMDVPDRVGAAGRVSTDDVVAESPDPLALIDVIAKVYDVPPVKPVYVPPDASVWIAGDDAGVDVTLYDVALTAFVQVMSTVVF
jgi:hypothetical protein